MKSATFVFAFSILFRLAFSQTNLVPNPSFEDTIFCPGTTNQIGAANYWMNFGNSPDYFNACTPMFLNVPNSQFGFQYANTGQAMAGVITYVWQFSPAWPDYREYVGVQLLSSLTIGQKYFISFFINFSGYLQGWQKIGANKLGMKFSMTSFSEFNPPPLDNFAHLFTDSILIDTVQWYKISGSFIADSAYNYVVLGNFFDTAQTDTVIFGGPPFGGSASYYYVDDICVTTDSLYNDTWTGLAESLNTGDYLTVFPNPACDILHVKTSNSIDEIQIINALGKIIQTLQANGKDNFQLSLLNVPSGLYLIKIMTTDNFFFEQVNIIH